MEASEPTPEEIFVLNKRVRLLQPPKGFRTSLDSVMLAAACPAQPADHVLDLGAGVGGAAFCLYKRVGCAVTGVELQTEYVTLARDNIPLNDATAKASFIQADIQDYKSPQPFDHVMCNPPYFESGGHSISPDRLRAHALGHLDEEMNIKSWVDAAFHNLKSNGSITMIHQASMTVEIVQALGRRFGAVEIIPLWPRAEQPAKRVIIRARKDRKTPCALHPGLVLHQADGRYTPITDGILRDMEPLN